MSKRVEFLLRIQDTLGAVPTQEAAQLNQAINTLLRDRGASLDALLGLLKKGCSIADEYNLYLRAVAVRDFFTMHLSHMHPRAAAEEMETNLDVLAQDRSDPNTDAHYKLLFAQLIQLDCCLPSARTIRELLR